MSLSGPLRSPNRNDPDVLMGRDSLSAQQCAVRHEDDALRHTPADALKRKAVNAS
jgi:hypothetical protein